jgi:hypothetical protein
MSLHSKTVISLEAAVGLACILLPPVIFDTAQIGSEAGSAALTSCESLLAGCSWVSSPNPAGPGAAEGKEAASISEGLHGELRLCMDSPSDSKV